MDAPNKRCLLLTTEKGEKKEDSKDEGNAVFVDVLRIERGWAMINMLWVGHKAVALDTSSPLGKRLLDWVRSLSFTGPSQAEQSWMGSLSLLCRGRAVQLISGSGEKQRKNRRKIAGDGKEHLGLG